MKPLFNQDDFNQLKSFDKLPCQCYSCNETFFQSKKLILQELTHKRGRIKFCSQKCYKNSKLEKIQVICTNCKSNFTKKLCESKKSKSGNQFCSKSCAATYNNKHKTHGNRRSKLEKWLEEQLTIQYPNLDIKFNQKEVIGSELDIYIPSLNIAFELNGIFHYEPIYGVNKLQQIQNNDIYKSKACHDTKLDLCIIDTSQQKYVKPSTSQKYLDIITNIIKERLSII